MSRPVPLLPRFGLPLTLLVATVPLATSPSAAVPSGLSEQTLVHDGLTRQYLVYTPRGASDLLGNRPLVLVLHGGGGTDRSMVRSTHRRFHELADRDGFYVVYPNAFDKMWDFGEGEVSERLERRVDDLGFFTALLERLEHEYPIDPERIFATGISRGGQASYFLACKLPGVFRAVAPVTMPLPRFLEDDCRDGPPVGIAILNGTEDPLVPYDGGQIRVFRQERGEVLATDATVDLWRRRNGCRKEGVAEVLPDVSDDGMRVERTRWSDCTGAPVTLYKILGGGHTWPGGRQYLPVSLVGPVTHDIDAADVIWSFFAALE